MMNDWGSRKPSALTGSRRRPWVPVIALAIASATPAWPVAQTLQINGAGATFPYPIYSAWFTEYGKARPDVQINYLSIGSGAGIQQLTDEIVFFAATDTPMTDDELLEAPGRILQLPTVIGAVAPIYNVPGIKGELRFSGPVLADIFLGRITNWNDPAIARLNGGVALPPTDITPIYRSESSGTSFIWSDFLSKVSPEWRRMIGVTRTLKPPAGAAARGSEGVSALVKQTPGAIGYVELIYARRNEIPIGLVQNAEGEFVRPSIEAATAAAAAAVSSMPRDFRVSITNAPGKGVYPISSFTWILLYESHRDRKRSRQMVEFMKWAFTDGQKLARDLGYAALPPEVVKLALAALGRIRVQ
jgi:phosphate transport system substrate-binding protein